MKQCGNKKASHVSLVMTALKLRKSCKGWLIGACQSCPEAPTKTRIHRIFFRLANTTKFSHTCTSSPPQHHNTTAPHNWLTHRASHHQSPPHTQPRMSSPYNNCLKNTDAYWLMVSRPAERINMMSPRILPPIPSTTTTITTTKTTTTAHPTLQT
ncbi:hypothetical protein E2C01_049450 [Portunus trituberculatus]|uniref:Uncharacterized protein n=1 Tax=Portunus trituberculatus TaxID=210409 RepID=A0A5B7G9G9_PORTR|nr:hypothetical protein [Portunus trituberculatus]